MAPLQPAFEIITFASAKEVAVTAHRIYNSQVETQTPTEFSMHGSLNFINAMQTQSFQHIKLLMLCEYTPELQILINIICMLICIFLISDIIYAHNFRPVMPSRRHIN